MIRNQILSCGTLIAAALTIAACGGSTSGATPTGGATAGALAATNSSAPARGAGDPCALVTQEEASTAIGAAAGAPEKTVSSCSYRGPAGEAAGVVVVRGTNRAAFDADRANAQGRAGYQDIPGTGDAAFMGNGGGSGQFECYKSSTVLQITLSLGRDGQVGDALLALGKAACGRV